MKCEVFSSCSIKPLSRVERVVYYQLSDYHLVYMMETGNPNLPVVTLLSTCHPSDLQSNLHLLQTTFLDGNPETSRAVSNMYRIPFQVIDSQEDGERPFLVCDYNASAAAGNATTKTYRSPWTNTVRPIVGTPSSTMNPGSEELPTKNTSSSCEGGDGTEQQGTEPPVGEDTGMEEGCADDDDDDPLRPLEASLNEVWDAYKNLYYGHEAVGSVFLRQSTAGYSFEALFGIQKKSSTGSWNSVSWVRANEPEEQECMYTVHTSVCVILVPTLDGSDNENCSTTTTDVSLTLSKEVTRTCKIQPEKGIPIPVSHIEHIGTIIEANEIDLRSNMEKVLIPKNQEILDFVQKKQLRRPQVNPLMGMVMNSDVLKKKLAKQASQNN